MSTSTIGRICNKIETLLSLNISLSLSALWFKNQLCPNPENRCTYITAAESYIEIYEHHKKHTQKTESLISVSGLVKFK